MNMKYGLTLAVLSTPQLFAANNTVQTELNLEGLKAKCVELSADEQLKPFKAVVSCKQNALEWRPSAQEAEPVPIENVKEIGASITMKGFSVPFQSETVATAPAQASCQIWEQVKITVPAVDIELDCEGISKVEKISDLCAPAIQEQLTADPGLQQVESTGKTFNTCQGR